MVQSGTPSANIRVPSIGSTTHTRPLVPGRQATLFATNAVGRTPLGEQLSDGQLGGRVDLSDRGGVGLELNLLAPPEGCQRHRRSSVSELKREGKVVLDHLVAHADVGCCDGRPALGVRREGLHTAGA